MSSCLCTNAVHKADKRRFQLASDWVFQCSYPDLQALTPAVLHDLVNKMYVCAPGKRSGHQAQDVNISPAYIGFPPQGILSETANHAAKSRTA